MTTPALVASYLLARCRARPRVLLVGGEPGVASALVEQGAEVLEVEAAKEKGRAFQPHAVLFGPRLAEAPDGEGHFRAVVEAAPGADVFLHVWNEGAAQELLGVLLGRQRRAGARGEAGVRQWLGACGLVLEERLPLPGEAQPLPLPTETVERLRSLLHQLSPDSSVDQFLYVARREAVAVPPSPEATPLVPGLLSIVLWAGSEATRAELDRTLFSIACQDQTPFELILVAPTATPTALVSLQELLTRYRGLADFESRLVAGEEPPARLLNRGIAAARGQYLSFLTPEAIVYPDHYRRLVAALGAGRSAWAFARARLAFTESSGGTPYIRARYPLPVGEELDWSYLLEGRCAREGFLVDRTRIGAFALQLAEDGTELDVAPLVVRLAALFTPAFTAGVASVEVLGHGAEEERAAARGQVSPRDGGLAPDLQLHPLLLSVGGLLRQLARVTALADAARGPHVAALDRLNQSLKQHLPSVHGALRNAARTLVSRGR